MAGKGADKKTLSDMTQGKKKKVKDRAVSAELRRLLALFAPLPENERKFLQPLFENAAFMKITLDGLQDEIREKGTVEGYQNGEHQSGFKISAAVQAYNQTIKNYNAVMDKLIDRLPAEEKKSDSLSQFKLK